MIGQIALLAVQVIYQEKTDYLCSLRFNVHQNSRFFF